MDRLQRNAQSSTRSKFGEAHSSHIDCCAVLPFPLLGTSPFVLTDFGVLNPQVSRWKLHNLHFVPGFDLTIRSYRFYEEVSQAHLALFSVLIGWISLLDLPYSPPKNPTKNFIEVLLFLLF